MEKFIPKIPLPKVQETKVSKPKKVIKHSKTTKNIDSKEPLKEINQLGYLRPDPSLSFNLNQLSLNSLIQRISIKSLY